MSIDESLPVLQSYYLGARDDATGALSGNWTLVSSTTSPGDVRVVLSTVNVFDQPTTAAVSPAARRNDISLPSPNHWRATALCRGDAGSTGRILFGVCGPLTSSNSITEWQLAAEFNQNIDSLRLSSFNVAIMAIPFNITVNEWYRMGIECYGNTAKLYFNTTGNVNPNSAPGIADLGVVSTVTLTSAQTPTGTVFPYFVFGGSAGANTTALCDFMFDSLAPPQPIESGSGSFIGGLTPSPYTLYKNVRQIAAAANLISLGP